MLNYDNIPKELKRLNQWVGAFADSKVPMQILENATASTTDSNTWSSFKNALCRYDHGEYDYCGFVFADNGYVGIDIDDGFDGFGLINELSADIIGSCKSYTEKSRSGRGFHIILKGNLPFKGKNNLKGVEIYKAGRYFIMTGDVLLYKDIIENQEAIDYIISKYFPETRDVHNSIVTDRIYCPIWEEPIVNGRIKVHPNYPKIPDGCRNISLTSLAGAMHTMGYSKKEIYNELKRVNAIACTPPLHDNELKTISNSVTRYKR